MSHSLPKPPGWIALTAVAVAAISGCGASGDATQTAHEKPSAHAVQVHKPLAAPSDPTEAEFVSAVANGTDNSLIDVRFRLSARPEVGKPLQVELWLQPLSAISDAKVIVSLRADDGLEVRVADRLQQYELTEAGTAIRSAIQVTATQAGVYNLAATVQVESNASSVSRTYNIPIIAI